ncbi:MAG: hypothetical protein JST20_07100 [Bacteroidetes bacterium]|nr:hypothetical protein [Bacteroidota bacterium]
MKYLFSTLIIAISVLLNACGNTTSPSTISGEIYGYVGLYNEYEVLQADQSGVTAELLEDGKVLQTVLTSADGMYSFKNVQAGVYDFHFFKRGYVTPYNLADTVVWINNQFVGRGKFKLVGGLQFYSTIEPDSTSWALKPEIRYQVIKDTRKVDSIWLRDTLIDSKVMKIWGSGTVETRKILFTVDYERTLPLDEMKRNVSVVIVNNYQQNLTIPIISNANVLFGECEYNSSNSIVRDSLGRIVNFTEKGGDYSRINVKDITVQANTLMPNGVKHYKDPKRFTKTKELKLSLID